MQTYPASHDLRRVRAFTLVEVLVVIGIIMMGLLLPTVNRARDNSRTVVCLSNLHQIVMACQAYSAVSENYIIPAQWAHTAPPPPGSAPLAPNAGTVNCNESWCNILVNGGYATAVNSLGMAPQTKGIFYCPGGGTDDGNLDPKVFSYPNYPTSRTDQGGAQPIRYYSVSKANTVDCWYGVNSDMSNSKDWTAGPPLRRVGETNFTLNPGSNDLIRRPSSMVMFFDGVFGHLANFNPNRLNARHGRETKTNIAFFDGHTATYQTASLPGGLKATTADYSLNNLKTKYGGAQPIWLLEQQ
jgi:prepilin-type processing-associated H-X9-DG protein